MNTIDLTRGAFEPNSPMAVIRSILQDREEPIETMTYIDAFDLTEQDSQGRWITSVLDRILHLSVAAGENLNLLLASRIVFESLLRYPMFVEKLFPVQHMSDMRAGFIGEINGSFLILQEDKDLLPLQNLYVCECADEAVQEYLKTFSVLAAAPETRRDIPVTLLTPNWRHVLDAIPPNLHLLMD